MRFDLTGLSATPTVIMSMPSSDHASLQTSFAQFAAAVAGGSTEAPGTSSSAGTSSAAACTSSAMAGPSSSARAAGSGFASKSGSSAPLSFSTKYVAWSPIEVDMISVPVLMRNLNYAVFRSQPMHRASAFLGSLVPRMQHLLGGGGMGGSGGHLHSSKLPKWD